MKPRIVVFENKEGQELSGRMDVPVDGQPIAYALLAHCFTCSKSLRAVGIISRALTRQGIAVLRFDFTGLGRSEGDFSDTNFSSNISDLVCAADFLASHYSAPQILIGHSLGGTASLHAAAAMPSVRAVATIAAPADPGHVRNHMLDSQDEIDRTGHAVVNLGGRPFTIRKQFLDDLESRNTEQVIARLGKALLIMHSPTDKIVGIEQAADIFRAARHPKSFISLDAADHLLTDESDASYVGSVLGSWVRKYLDSVQEETKHQVPGDNCIVATIGSDHYSTDILANGHSLLSDEPRSLGGTNTGPTPYGLMLAGLGACTAITLRMYADRKGWPLEKVTVQLSHQKVHAKDCDCEAQDRSGRIDLIKRGLLLEGDLDEKQIARLMEIADRCPVHRTLHNEPVVKTILMESEPAEDC